MVFSTHRRRRKHILNATKSLPDLPDEIIEAIVEALHTQDVLNLKLATNIRIWGICNEIVGKRCKVLYLHPSKRALKRFFDICAHPLFSKEVETLVLLGKDILPAISTLNQRERWRSADDPGHSPRTRDRPTWAAQFRPWPYHITSSETTNDQKTVDVSFSQSYRVLLEAIEHLPKLRYLAFQESTTQDAKCGRLNSLSDTTIAAHAHRYSKDQPTGNLERAEATHGVGRSDAAVLFSLWQNVTQNIKSLKLDIPLTFVTEAECNVLSKSTDTGALRNAFSNLARLDITIDRHCFDDRTITGYRNLFTQTSVTLEELRICFTPDRSFKKWDRSMQFEMLGSLYGQLLGRRSGYTKMPRLRIFELDMPPRSDRIGRPDRPCFLNFDPMTFLYTHRATLASVSFRNIIFGCGAPLPLLESLDIPVPTVTPMPGARISALTTLSLALTVFSKHLPILDHCEWLIPRYQHHPNCKKENDWLVDHGGSFACGHYEPKLHNRMVGRVDAYVAFAESVGVEVNEKTEFWDFGKRAMEMLRMERESEGAD